MTQNKNENFKSNFITTTIMIKQMIILTMETGIIINNIFTTTHLRRR